MGRLPPADVRAFMVGWVSGGLVIMCLALACREHPTSSCMAECPAAPAGCVRTSVDPGACAEGSCAGPVPVCHYAPVDASDGFVCPEKLAGRCVGP